MLTNVQLLHQKWLNFWKLEGEYPNNQNIQFVLRILGIVFLYFILNFTIPKFSAPPHDIYYEKFIMFGFLKYIVTSFKIVLIIPLLFFLIIGRNQLWRKWDSFSYFKPIRAIVLVSTFLLVWTYSTYDLNLLVNQAHWLDRLLLILLLPLIWWRPIFTFIFLPIVFIIIGQFTALGGFSWTIPYLALHIIILFCSFFAFSMLTKSDHPLDFLFCLGVLVMAHYWNSGFGKLNQEWLMYDQIFYLLPNTYANGWLGFLSTDAIEAYTKALMPFSIVIKILTILLEVGCMFFFVHRKIARVFLFSFIFFHLGIFLTSGIFFWHWMILDALFLMLIIRKDAFTALFQFNRWQILFSILLIVTSQFWTNPIRLAWHDVPMTYTYIFEAKCTDGSRVHLPPSFFAPFDYQFTLGRFNYLSSKRLPITWGASNGKITKWFRKNKPSKETIFEFEKTNGEQQYNEERKTKLTSFIKQWGKNWNERQSKSSGLSNIQSPRYLWTFPRHAFKDKPKPIEKIHVIELTTYFHNDKYEELRREPLYEITLDN